MGTLNVHDSFAAIPVPHDRESAAAALRPCIRW